MKRTVEKYVIILFFVSASFSCRSTSSKPPQMDQQKGVSADVVVDELINSRVTITANLKSDEELMILPTFAQTKDGRDFELQLHAWVFEPELHSVSRDIFVSFLKIAFDVDESGWDEKIFQQRVRYFLVDNERDKKIQLRVDAGSPAVATTQANGHGFAINGIKLSKTISETLWIRPRLAGYFNDGSPSPYYFQLVPFNGFAVVSDIDDTIKISEVTDKSALLRRTFGEAFEPVEGMADFYSRLKEEFRPSFHYVSASPWQLYPSLSVFVDDYRFPRGSFHLKTFRFKDESFFSLFEDPITYKLALLKNLFESFPNKKFFLIGDSGEKDPEVYAKAAELFPDQIQMIYIRTVSGHAIDDARFKTVFANIPIGKWTVFKDPSEL